MDLAKRVKTMTPSSTLAISAKAKELKEKGHDVIGLGVGEPDFNTPQYIIEAAKRAMDDGMTKYTPSGGIIELKEVIRKKFKTDNKLTFTNNEIIVTTGAKHALFTLFQTILDEGDEVIVPAPYWVSYPEQVKLASGTPVYVEAKEENDFKLTPNELEQAITDKTMMYTKEELEDIGKVCIENNLLIVSDEIYEKLIYTNDEHISIAQLSTRLKEQTVIINGVSKSHAMTGWRIGYAAGPEYIIKAMTSHASHATSNPTSIAQYAALAAYDTETDPTIEMRQTFSKRLNTLYDLLTDIPGVNCKKPNGAFYLFPNVTEAAKMNGFETVDEWVGALLEEEKVALVPGSGFGAPNNVRLSYATSLELLEEAARRIKSFVLSHQK